MANYEDSRTPSMFRLARALAPLLLLLGLTHAAGASEGRTFEFSADGVTLDAGFPGARLNDCRLEENGDYRVLIRPENEPINNSAWYAFRVSAETARTVTIQLAYEGGKHRYPPKISSDGKTWWRLSNNRYRREGQNAIFTVAVGPEPVWIAGQEMIGVEELGAWTDRIAALPFVEETVIGRSVGDRSIRQLRIAEGAPKYAIAIVGRQHPPEVTGTMALIEFVETLTGSGDLAREFRRSFEIVVVPLMNPDGVAAGNWRHNLNGVDLNRDWGPFRQPETQAVRDSILRYQAEGTPRLAFFLDFHSTHHDVFYVQTGEETVWPEGLSQRWLKALAAAMPDYRVRQEPNAGTRPLSKVWARSTMNVPAVIYEVGDNTDRDLIRRVARVAAEKMMRVLLDAVSTQ